MLRNSPIFASVQTNGNILGQAENCDAILVFPAHQNFTETQYFLLLSKVARCPAPERKCTAQCYLVRCILGALSGTDHLLTYERDSKCPLQNSVDIYLPTSIQPFVPHSDRCTCLPFMHHSMQIKFIGPFSDH